MFHTRLKNASKLKRNSFKWSECSALEKKRSGEDPAGHRQSCAQSHTKNQTSARLGQSHNIGHRVDDAGPHKHPEVPESSGEIRPSECIQKTDHHKGNDVFQIILMASGIQEQSHQKKKTTPSSLTQWSCHKQFISLPSHSFHIRINPDQFLPVFCGLHQGGVLKVCKNLKEESLNPWELSVQKQT